MTTTKQMTNGPWPPTPNRRLGASVEKRVRHVHDAFEDAPYCADERGALDDRRRARSVGDQVHLDVTRRVLDAEHAAGKSLRLDVAARDGSGKHRGGADGKCADHGVRAYYRKVNLSLKPRRLAGAL